ncbi:MarR family transcriptional regulator [Halostreptopolyspora alba]|uniref:MarR family transcriptional regulator n=1 Tax=Halostreptopolyspora alba TaxID=2487137 RepID=A0A3N0EI64_9ACTN|nr:MarR family transcriptional regulator [Nocardiopsaceae bacterium YIM 96095]
MDDRERLLELLRTIQSSVIPSLVRGHEEHDITLLHAALLQALNRGGEPTVRELADLIGRSVSRTSRLVGQLESRELAQRREDPDDRRVRRVRISASGRAVLDEVQRMRVAAQLELWEHLAADERATVLHAMELLAKAARRYRDERG